METKHNSDSELGMLRGVLLGEIDSEGKRLKVCLISTFIFGLVAHGFGFMGLIINGDSLSEFYLSMSAAWKISLGRFMEPALRYLMGETITLPWMTGLAGLLFVGLAVHLISKMFSLDTVWENMLVSGICVTNITITSIIATFIHDFAGDMMALLLSVGAAYAWFKMKRGISWKYTLWGAVCLCASFGFYQAYLSVMITLLVMTSIMNLLQGDSAKTVIQRLLRAVPIGLLAVIGYFVCVSLSLHVFGLELAGDEGNNISYIGKHLRQVVELIKEGYYWVIFDIISPNDSAIQGVFQSSANVICLFNAVLLVLSAVTVFRVFKKNRVHLPEIMLALILIALIPACMICVGIISTAFHHLTRYAVCLYYLMVLCVFKLGRESVSPKSQRWRILLPLCLIGIIIFNNIQISNTAYVKKDLERQSTLSTMTRTLSVLEQYDGYSYGESEVAIFNVGNMNKMSLNVGAVDRVHGLSGKTQVDYRQALERYFDIVLQYPINLCSVEKEKEIEKTDAFKAMGTFPAKNCVATIDGIVVIKMFE